MAGQFGNGVTWEYDDTAKIDGTPSYTAVADIHSVSFNGFTAETHDASIHGTTWREIVNGLKTSGEVTLGLRFRTTEVSHKAVMDDLGKAPHAHKFTWPLFDSGNTIPFSIEANGTITNAAPNGPHDDVLDMSVTVTLSGAPTITQEAAA